MLRCIQVYRILLECSLDPVSNKNWCGMGSVHRLWYMIQNLRYCGGNFQKVLVQCHLMVIISAYNNRSVLYVLPQWYCYVFWDGYWTAKIPTITALFTIWKEDGSTQVSPLQRDSWKIFCKKKTVQWKCFDTNLWKYILFQLNIHRWHNINMNLLLEIRFYLLKLQRSLCNSK